jgi:hypothetical protein
MVWARDVAPTQHLEALPVELRIEARLQVGASGVELGPLTEKPRELQHEHLLVDLPEAGGGDRRPIQLAGADLRHHRGLVTLLPVPEELQLHSPGGAVFHGLLPHLEDLAPWRVGGREGADLQRRGIGAGYAG